MEEKIKYEELRESEYNFLEFPILKRKFDDDPEVRRYKKEIADY